MGEEFLEYVEPYLITSETNSQHVLLRYPGKYLEDWLDITFDKSEKTMIKYKLTQIREYISHDGLGKIKLYKINSNQQIKALKLKPPRQLED